MESELSHQFKFINPRGNPYNIYRLPLIRLIIIFLNKYEALRIIHIYYIMLNYKYNKRTFCKK